MVLRYLFLELSMDALQLDFDGRTNLDCVPRRGTHDSGEYLQRAHQRHDYSTDLLVSFSPPTI